MEQLVQCPVCTLFLHNGMSLESHLDTHPKDQVIKALCNLSANNVGFGSRTSTPAHSERSYRSRSRTPAEDSPRWSGRSIDNERYWRRTPSRSSKTPASSIARNATPSDIQMGDINFENNSNNATSSPYPAMSFMKPDKSSQPFLQNVPGPEFDPQYVYYPDQQEDKEIKYSRSAEYSAIDNTSNVFTYNMPSVAPTVKLQPALMPTASRRNNDLVKILPKPNNILVKANVGGVQYITPGVKPMHLVVPTAPSFVQKSVQNNMIVSGSIPASQIMEPKSVATPLASSSSTFNQLSTGTFTPGTTVVTQNSQIIYREMVHNLDGKPFISSMPAVLSGHDNVTNVAATSSMYQNVMVVDPFGNTSCMYTTPQQILSKQCTPPVYSEVSMSNLEKTLSNPSNESNKTLIIEVGPIVAPQVEVCSTSTNTSTSQASQTIADVATTSGPEKQVERNDIPGSTKGLKILSNIKVEVPVQHHKNLLNTIVDLTGSQEPEYTERAASPERILPDFEDNHHSLSGDCLQPTTSNDSIVSNTFSVIKNVGNPPSYKDSVSKSSVVDNKIDNEFSDSCPMPDLICNEKPSISPCSELSESGDNSTDRISISPKPEPPPVSTEPPVETTKPPPKPSFRSAPLRLNNIFVKKHKKILEIKNSKSFTVTPCSSKDLQMGPSSPARPPENFTMNKIHSLEISKEERTETLQTITVEVCAENDNSCSQSFDADTSEQSMELEPVACSSLRDAGQLAAVRVKEEVNSSNEGFGEERALALAPAPAPAPLEAMRPINVIAYGALADFDDDSNHKELLELEASSKNKQFVSMMSDNYFGDNMYAEYFTPERERQAFEAREKDAYLWGAAQRDGEFVLPTFVHDGYKVADGGAEYAELRERGAPQPHAHAHADADEPWTPMYREVAMAGEGYDLLARESWLSDADDDSAEKQDCLETAPRAVTCALCRVSFASRAELRAHRLLAHAHAHTRARRQRARQLARRLPPLAQHQAGGQARSRTTAGTTQLCVLKLNWNEPEGLRYFRAVPSFKPSRRERTHVTATSDPSETDTLLLPDSKEALSSSILFPGGLESKPVLVKQEPRRRRRDHTCPTCKVDQGSEAAFTAHLKMHPLECLTCGKCFFRRANLALHLKTHQGIKNFKCEVCEKRFLTRQKLQEHHNTHTGRAPYKCTVCDETFRRYSNMVQHRDRHHLHKKRLVRDFVCACGAVFHSRAKLRWHAETHAPRPHACPTCGDKFLHQASLTRHVRRAHDPAYTDAQRPRQHNVPCPVCKQVYLRSNLRAHLLTHSGKRPYVCVVCSKAFTTKWNLKLHRWTHASRSAKPYKCSLCKGAFVRHSEYVSHMNAHKAVRPYTCNYCGCQFIRKYNCQRHVREHETAKKYVCKVAECGKSFHRSYYLSEHMKVHSGARPFACGVCGKLSGNKSNHNKHVRIHHAREPVASEA
ncbi:uncharacterized protein LOC125234576 [Leguminivora glycinivorella]|uniref:uncharacterized protein LOC125234576 n=1 Tax=Leguminivora glycinivorella TaxID=1035111 RepID=UPI00200E9508|nr:uncharacterized protein LOC125234576 [Leguminivora glycinivorella]